MKGPDSLFHIERAHSLACTLRRATGRALTQETDVATEDLVALAEHARVHLSRYIEAIEAEAALRDSVLGDVEAL